MYFELLHSRLVDYLRIRVKSGEMTERGLARLAGISQPHLHNVLKGVRLLSAGTADMVVMNLHLSAFDLVREEELARPGRPPTMPYYRDVPVASGRLGPGHPFPNLQESAGWLPFSAAELQDIPNPIAVRLAPDPDVPSIFRAGDIVLLELLPPGRQSLRSESYYAIDAGQSGLLRSSRSLQKKLGSEPPGPVHQEQTQGSPAGVVRGRAIWIGRYLQARPEDVPTS